ncbi:hypothetical protein AX774_g4535 [Zancudomyces culisetae]|uniref:Uncharacterized protein n=1 Tax=Zancudomyces culisetae TaxID=1213189 RepID=A0A1R1PHZ7_ZANCU|nr:hypothetical protein AX774_g5960 [Zancudomyces culisetae]OMH82000.1 hypothetical protein AX774_g4535 [Zancudomyces culisetae]|eukprot:OMH80601.1 hypothetical protein AX774_g5960 [Zancudomyces culisetae]
MYIFRENRYIVIEFDEYETTAILGVNNLNVQPHVRVKSVVGYFNEELKEDAKSKELAESYEISKNSVKDNDEPSNEKTERSTNEDEGNIERMECENRNEKEEMVGSKETVLCSEKSDNQPKGEFSAEIGNNLTLEGEQKRVEMGDSENQKPEKNSNLAGAVQSLNTVGKSGDAKDILNERIESKSTEAHNNTEPKEKIEQLQKSEGTVVADAIKTPEASANVEAGEGSADVSNISTLDTSEAKDRFENEKVEKSGKDEGNNMAEQENKTEEMMEVDSQVEKMEVDSEPKPEVEQPNENDMVVEQKVYKQKCIVGDDIEKIGLSEPIRAEGIIKEGVICNWEAFRDFW